MKVRKINVKKSSGPRGPADAFATSFLPNLEMTNRVALLTMREMKARGMPVEKLRDRKTYLRRARKNLASEKIK